MASGPIAGPRAGWAVQGHRGASGLLPENTLAAFRRAILLGADGAEMDLQVTRDGEVVIIHDDRLDRTTDRQGRIRDLTLDEIRQADAGCRISPPCSGERVPTLRELIHLVRTEADPAFRLNCEIKFADGAEGEPADIEERVLAVLRETDFVSRVTVQSFHHPSPATMKRLEPRIPVGLLVGERRPVADPVARVREFGADYFAPHHSLVTGAMVAALHAAGIPVVAWTVNQPEAMRRLVELGIGGLAGDAIISDYPNRALELRRQLGG